MEPPPSGHTKVLVVPSSSVLFFSLSVLCDLCGGMARLSQTIHQSLYAIFQPYNIEVNEQAQTLFTEF